MIGTWTQLPDGTWGVRVHGRAHPGSIVTVRFKDAREPRTEIVREVLSVTTDEAKTVSLCTIERKTPA
jgi:hypothetical protein